MNPGLLHQVAYALVARQILQAHELHQQQQQLSAQYLVAMGTGRVPKLGFPWSGGNRQGGGGINMKLHPDQRSGVA